MKSLKNITMNEIEYNIGDNVDVSELTKSYITQLVKNGVLEAPAKIEIEDSEDE